MEILNRDKAKAFLLNLRQEVRDREEEILLEQWFNEFYPLQNELSVFDNLEDINDGK